MTTIVCCSIIVVLFLVAMTYIISFIKGKKLSDIASSTSYKTQKEDDGIPKGFIDFIKNNINEENRYKIKNSIYK